MKTGAFERLFLYLQYSRKSRERGALLSLGVLQSTQAEVQKSINQSPLSVLFVENKNSLLHKENSEKEKRE